MIASGKTAMADCVPAPSGADADPSPDGSGALQAASVAKAQMEAAK
jgi:hypothetical protein